MRSRQCFSGSLVSLQSDSSLKYLARETTPLLKYISRFENHFYRFVAFIIIEEILLKLNYFEIVCLK